jgi:adenylate kinase
MLRLLLFILVTQLGISAQEAGKGLVMVLIGPPGGGKTTQSEALSKRYKVPVVAGDAALSDDALRARLKALDVSRGFILDGYPATRRQADFLGAVVKELKLPSPIILQLEVPDDVVRQRLAGKQKPEALEKSLAQYHKEMDLFREYYPQADIWTVIGTRPISEVTQTIVSLIQDRH